MYLPTTWVLLIVISLGASFAAFFWGLRSGQFTDQERARYLPLSPEHLSPRVANPARLTPAHYALMAIGAMAVLIFAAAIILSLQHAGG